MSKFVLKNATILFDKYNLSGELNEVTINLTKADVDITVHGQSAMARLGGLKSLDASWSGFFEAGSTGLFSDNISFASLGSDTKVLTIIPEGATVGDPCYTTRVTQFEYSTGGSVGDAMSFSGSALSSGGDPIVRGYLLCGEAFVSAGANNGTAVNTLAPSTIGVRANDTLYGVYHCVGTSVGTSCAIKIQSDEVGFSSPTDVITFTGITSTTEVAEWKTDTDTDTNTYWRSVVTPVGVTVSYEIYCVAGIIPNVHYPRVVES